MNKIKKILLGALFLASTIVLGRILSIRTPIITIGFSFVPIMLTAILLGPKYSIFVSVMGDFIGAILFPSGSYFFGFTITAFLTGLIYGLLLYNPDGFQLNKKFVMKLVISTILVTGLLNGILNTVWIMMITKSASKIVVPVRIAKQLIMAPIKIMTILGIAKVFEKRFMKMMKNDSIR